MDRRIEGKEEGVWDIPGQASGRSRDDKGIPESD